MEYEVVASCIEDILVSPRSHVRNDVGTVLSPKQSSQTMGRDLNKRIDHVNSAAQSSQQQPGSSTAEYLVLSTVLISIDMLFARYFSRVKVVVCST